MTDKMTTERALEYFKHRLKCGQCGKDTIQRHAFDMAIEALEKQIPKKTLIANGWVQCPKCGLPLSLYEKWCDSCGQAIAWESDTDG